MHRRVIIVQARMQSRRFPGKVMQEIAGKSLLQRQLARLRRCTNIDDICIATTENTADDSIAEFANRNNVSCYRGAVEDVLTRYLGAARWREADVVVRVTGDCPLVDPQVIDRVMSELTDHASACDYASNVLERTFPRGLDVEAFFFDTLARMDRLARLPAEREHVTLVARGEHRDTFLSRSVLDEKNNADLRWTVDVPADLDLLRRLHGELDLESPTIGHREIVRHIRAHPELTRINAAAATWDPLEDCLTASFPRGAV